MMYSHERLRDNLCSILFDRKAKGNPALTDARLIAFRGGNPRKHIRIRQLLRHIDTSTFDGQRQFNVFSLKRHFGKNGRKDGPE